MEKQHNLPIRGSLKEGNAPKELLEKYHQWLEKARTAEIPIWYSKHVRLWFVYQGIQYELYPEEFDHYLWDHYQLAFRGYGFDHGIAECFFDDVIIPDLIAMGVPKNQISHTGSID